MPQVEVGGEPRRSHAASLAIPVTGVDTQRGGDTMMVSPPTSVWRIRLCCHVAPVEGDEVKETAIDGSRHVLEGGGGLPLDEDLAEHGDLGITVGSDGIENPVDEMRLDEAVEACMQVLADAPQRIGLDRAECGGLGSHCRYPFFVRGSSLSNPRLFT
ncbi:hypothetical protein [Corynebacterium efficiens YS-314]|uniref:Uncharacterized protein n=1 Tax=Corynebacterium efficiens (strain DSM 44549 / YS-314 / AJ 12310 / JCM 11189 / NBRC 100395) TaxID=196164 RepID=Q8FNB1_COREF|nr:hypothetical protein [Corynebacterium efficiens YS-314]